MAQNTKTVWPQDRHWYDSNVIVRLALVVVLCVTFVGALRWAMNVTQANARQVSSNLKSLQRHMGNTPPDTNRFNNAPGPIIEPEEEPRITKRR